MTSIAAELRVAATLHARLLDSFIEQVRAEMNRCPDGYTRDSLTEMLENLRKDRQTYDFVGGLHVVENVA